MARTVAVKRKLPKGPYPGVGACGFCITKTQDGVRHDLCPTTIHTAAGKKDDRVWSCQCAKEGHRS